MKLFPGAGWGFPGAARKAHFFNGASSSLCGGWMFAGRLETEDITTPSKDDCKPCRTKLETILKDSPERTAP